MYDMIVEGVDFC